MGDDDPERLPVIEKFTRQCAGLLMRRILVLFAKPAEGLYAVAEAGREIDRGALTRFINRDHQLVEEFVGGLSKGPCFAAEAFLESLGLAQHVRPATQPLLEAAIDPVAIAHQPADKPFAKDILHDFLAAVTNEVQADGRGDDHPQPQ